MAKVIAGERIGKQGRLAIGCSAAVFDASRQRLLLIRRADNRRWAVPGGNRLQLVVLHFDAEPIGGDLSRSDESSELNFFSQTEALQLDVGPLDRLRIMDAFTAQERTIIRDEF